MKPDLSSLPEWSRPWAEHRLSQTSHDISREQWNSLGDWLTALPIERPKMPAKLHKLTMAQALRASVLWHEDMARRAERIRDDQSSFGGDPNAIQVLADGGQGWRWVRVTSPEGLDYEGNAMGHCVGRGNYDDDVTIISLRDKHNMPHCTIEWDEKNRWVKQVQGRANGSTAEKYHESIGIFINSLESLIVRGANKFWHVFTKGQLIHWSNLPDGLALQELNLEGFTGLTHLPDKLTADYINIKNCTGLTQIPNGLSVKALGLYGCTGLRHLPDGLTAEYINLMNCTGLTHLPNGLITERIYLNGCINLTSLPNGLIAEYLNLEGCVGITCLPDGLNVKELNLWGCIGLTHLPDGLTLEKLDLAGCTGLTHLPDGLSVKTLILNGCTGLTYLPDGLNTRELDLEGCVSITELPDGLIAEELYLSNCTGLTHLPDGLNAKYIDIKGCTRLISLPSDLNLDCLVSGGDHLIPMNNPLI